MVEGRTVTTYAQVETTGKLLLHNQKNFMQNLADNFKGCNGRIVFIEESEELRHNWRSYYFGILIPEAHKAFRYAGFDFSKEDVDTFLRDRFLYREAYNPGNDTWQRVSCTLRKGETDVSHEEFKEYCMKCIWLVAEYLDHQVPYIREEMST